MSRTIPVALQTHLNAAGADKLTLTTLAIFTRDPVRSDGAVYRFCLLDHDLTYGGNLYRSALGFTRSDLVAADDLSVDNTNIVGAINSGTITDDDLRAGKWDYATFRMFMVNYRDLTMGEIKVARGWFGECTMTRNKFEVELRRMMEAYSRVIGRIYSPACDAVLGDTRCGIDLGPLTVTGMLEGVSDDGMTLYDSARTEDGPADPVGISAISKAAAAVVTTATPHGYVEGEAVVHSLVEGMVEANGVWQVHNPTADTYEIALDSTDLATYIGSGESAPLSNTGWFDFGVITMMSGAAAGRSMEVKSFTPGQIVTQLPFELPLGVHLEPGDTYSMTPGCDKTFSTCVAKFANGARFRGFPHLRGNDALVQVGRHD